MTLNNMLIVLLVIFYYAGYEALEISNSETEENIADITWYVFLALIVSIWFGAYRTLHIPGGICLSLIAILTAGYKILFSGFMKKESQISVKEDVVVSKLENTSNQD